MARFDKCRPNLWMLLTLLTAVLGLPLIARGEQRLTQATPESQGMDSTVLQRMVDHVEREQLKFRSIMVLRNGHIVFQWYAAGIDQNDNHNIYSVTKSVVATLAGLAMEQSDLQTTSTVVSMFPERQDAIGSKSLAQVTLTDLLTMRSGLPTARANKSSGPERDLFRAIHSADDRIGQILQLKPVRRVGKIFRYNNLEPQLVLGAIENATHEKALEFAEQNLFQVLQFENYQWRWPDKTGLPAGGYGLRLRTIDMAKLGQLYLQRGVWDSQQLLSPEFVTAATGNATGNGYGYFWWTDMQVGRFKAYAAKGLHGQMIQVVPALDLVMVTTANLPSGTVRPTLSTLANQYVLKATSVVGPRRSPTVAN